MPFFKSKEKLEHYTAVADGTKSVKADSKFSTAEQQAYARGQRDARNEERRSFAWKNSTPEQRADYKAEKARQREIWKANKANAKAVKKAKKK